MTCAVNIIVQQVPLTEYALTFISTGTNATHFWRAGERARAV